MVVKYDYNTQKDLLLSPHFRAYEFRSHYNNRLTTNEILVDTELLDKLEKLIPALKAKYAVLTSAYRNRECDILVGGSGVGQHVLGKAVDIIFYDEDEGAIDSKLVCCKAQDVGFNGIARINDKATHLDVRSGKKYYGDETISTNTVTDNFYKYFNIQNDYEITQKRFGFSQPTMDYLQKYQYANDLFYKLANEK